jgi:arylsulfatase A-like enzyme
LRGNVPAGPANQWRRELAGYYAHCSALDDCVGDLLQTLRETGLDRNTIVIFTADHGTMLGSQGMAAKQRPYDESIRVPLLFHCPLPGFKARRLDAVIATEDFMPTVLGLCGSSIPGSVQGSDYSGYMRGKRDPSDGAAVISCVAPFAEWSARNGGREFRGIRTGRFTYVRDLEGPWLLFDDKKDPLQLTNLVNTPGAAGWQKKLEAQLRDKLRRARDDFLPATAYIKQWGYHVDGTGTVPFSN